MEQIEQKESLRYLGVLIDEKLLFEDHINSVVRKLRRKSGIISKIRHYYPRKVIKLYFSAHISLMIEYGILFYGCTTYSKLDRILKIQKNIVRMIFFSNFKESTYESFCNNTLLTVHEFYVKHLLMYSFKSVNDLHKDERQKKLPKQPITQD